MSGPERIDGAPRPGESSDDWFRRVMGERPPAVAEAEAPAPQRTGRKQALVRLEQTIPQAYRWAHFDAPELSERVHRASVPIATSSSAEPRMCLMGISRAGKTSLRAMQSSDAGVLQCAYELRAWPVALWDELGRLTGVVVRLACALDHFPEDRRAQQVIEMARASWLAQQCPVSAFDATVIRLRREAQARFARAHHAYGVLRGNAPQPGRSS
jgi:hypothetical protein